LAEADRTIRDREAKPSAFDKANIMGGGNARKMSRTIWGTKPAEPKNAD